ncbi:MAG TPA: hypothetical protein VKE22_05355 [Haliangiales bacterium]|nr:hypothetical protein [Haliangiales bacterium]
MGRAIPCRASRSIEPAARPAHADAERAADSTVLPPDNGPQAADGHDLAERSFTPEERPVSAPASSVAGEPGAPVAAAVPPQLVAELDDVARPARERLPAGEWEHFQAEAAASVQEQELLLNRSSRQMRGPGGPTRRSPDILSARTGIDAMVRQLVDQLPVKVVWGLGDHYIPDRWAETSPRLGPGDAARRAPLVPISAASAVARAIQTLL